MNAHRIRPDITVVVASRPRSALRTIPPTAPHQRQERDVIREDRRPPVLTCPEPACNAPAAIVDHWSWPSTDGPVEHVKVRCLDGHWYTPTADSVAARQEVTAP